MQKKKITVETAGIKMNLITANVDEVTRMASSLDTAVRRKMQKTGGRLEHALLMLTMEQAEALKKNVTLIHSQQEQIFSLMNKNSSLAGEAPESAPLIETENTIMLENERLRRRIDELTDEIACLRNALANKDEAKL